MARARQKTKAAARKPARARSRNKAAASAAEDTEALGPSERSTDVVEDGEAVDGVPLDGTPGDGMPDVGPNLRRVRTARGMPLEALAHASGVSRAMLSQIELGRSMPTIKLLWKVARALDLPFSALLSTSTPTDETAVLRGERARRLTSHDGKFSSRALFPTDRPRRTEFYELRLAARALEEAEPHSPGTVENLLVARGSVVIRVGDVESQLEAGDAIQFRADGPHSYRNTSTTEAVMYLVMSYTDVVAPSVGWSV